jgi:hypothetical protein
MESLHIPVQWTGDPRNNPWKVGTPAYYRRAMSEMIENNKRYVGLQ